jgi:hypothetical protein
VPTLAVAQCPPLLLPSKASCLQALSAQDILRCRRKRIYVHIFAMGRYSPNFVTVFKLTIKGCKKIFSFCDFIKITNEPLFSFSNPVDSVSYDVL